MENNLHPGSRKIEINHLENNACHFVISKSMVLFHFT